MTITDPDCSNDSYIMLALITEPMVLGNARVESAILASAKGRWHDGFSLKLVFRTVVCMKSRYCAKLQAAALRYPSYSVSAGLPETRL